MSTLATTISTSPAIEILGVARYTFQVNSTFTPTPGVYLIEAQGKGGSNAGSGGGYTRAIRVLEARPHPIVFDQPGTDGLLANFDADSVDAFSGKDGPSGAPPATGDGEACYTGGAGTATHGGSAGKIDNNGVAGGAAGQPGDGGALGQPGQAGFIRITGPL